MVIQNGLSADANDINSSLSKLFKNSMQSFFNSDIVGWNAGLNAGAGPSVSNLQWNTFQTDSMTKTNCRYDSTGKYYMLCNPDDEMDGASIANHWSSYTSGGGSVSETGGYIQVSGGSGGGGDSNYVTSDTTAPIDYYDASNNYQVHFRMDVHYAFSAFYYAAPKAGLTDGTNFVELTNYPGGEGSDNSETGDVWDWVIKQGSKTVDTYKNGVLVSSGVSIASLTGHYYFRFGDYQNLVGGQYTRVYYLYSIKQNREHSIVSSATTAGSTITNATLTLNGSGCNGYVNLAANGSSYEGVTVDTIHLFSATGTSLKFKANLTPSTLTTYIPIPIIYEYAILYGWW